METSKIIVEGNTFTIVPFGFAETNMLNDKLNEERAARLKTEETLSKVIQLLGITRDDLE